MTIKCKMCGGDLHILEDSQICECEFCGTCQTVPHVDDEKKTNLFNRANKLRRNADYDKATSVYASITAEFPEESEAYWGLCLCKYGIEYVDDPTSGRKVPTCHRTLTESIMDDSDFDQACENTDPVSLRLYREEAKEIDRIQKSILNIVANEKPYDVFICYKETDENGERTEDSVLSQEIYDALTGKGIRVFFSRISLEDKLGQEYEPYIYAALYSAKVLIAVGTKYEYYNAVWVKNEWTRFLSMMKNDKSKALIPCYKDLDAYDMPKEFKNLQGQDASKIGWLQDLTRGILKLCGKGDKDSYNRIPIEAGNYAAPSMASLMERVRLFMEDRDFQNANEYLNKILDIEPKNSSAYILRVCASLGLRTESELAETSFLYEDNPDWQKALRFANPEEKTLYERYLEKVKSKIQKQIRDYAYDCAIEMAVKTGTDRKKLDTDLSEYIQACNHSSDNPPDGSRRLNGTQNEELFRYAVNHNEPRNSSTQDLESAAEMFDLIGDSEAKDAADKCRKLAIISQHKTIYVKAKALYFMAGDNEEEIENAARLLQNIPEYKDSKELAQSYMEEANKIKEKKERKTNIDENVIQLTEQYHQKNNDYQDSLESIKRSKIELKKLEKKLEYHEIELREYNMELCELNGLFSGKRKKQLEQELIPSCIKSINEIHIHIDSLRRNILQMTTILPQEPSEKDLIYQIATVYKMAGFNQEAFENYSKIKGYKDVDSLLYQERDLSSITSRMNVKFGTYPQTSDGSDHTAIEWIALGLDAEKNKILLMSRYGLDVKPYNIEHKQVTWETCSIRTWLNSTFLNKAFSSEEQSWIMVTTVNNSYSQGYNGWKTAGGSNTDDKLFLLSYNEAKNFLNVSSGNCNNYISRITATKYAMNAGAYSNGRHYDENNDAFVGWWLRSPGEYQDNAAIVCTDGSLFDNAVDTVGICIRPALWIDINAGIF